MLDALMATPTLIKVLATLSLILLINRYAKSLAVSIAVGSAVLAFWCGHHAGEAARIAGVRFVSADNLLLLAIVAQVIWLSSQMSDSGVMADLVAAVRARVSQRASMAVLPAVIGWLPMPGGALFSAPLVESLDADGAVQPHIKALTNHWYRHIWEFWWPIYPGVLLAMQITKLEPWQFMLIGLPLTIWMTAVGYFFLLRRIAPSGSAPEALGVGGRSAARQRKILPLLLPIIVVIAVYALVRGCYGALQAAWPSLGEMNRYVPMAIGLACAMGILQAQRPLTWRQWTAVLFSRRVMTMLVIVAMVRIYGAFIDAPLPDGQTVPGRMQAEMQHWHIPPLLIVGLLPLVSGLATGLSIGFVGASFPIVMGTLAPDAPLHVLLATTALAYGFGFAGMFISPMHVCLVVSSEHFRTRLLHNMATLVLPVMVVLAGSVLMYLALR